MQVAKTPTLAVPDLDRFEQAQDQPFDRVRKIRQADKTRRKLQQLGAQRQLREGIRLG